MDFFAEQINQFPTLSYIALVGEMTDDLDEELIRRIRRINKASPEKTRFALDVRGITGLEPSHFDVFVHLRDELEERGLELYLCNLPKRFKRFFSSGRVQRELNVCSSKQELFQQLASKPSEQTDPSDNGDDSEKRESEVAPIPVTLSTREGVRLFEAYAINLDRERRMYLKTDDHSAAQLPSDFEQELQLTFNSQVLQMAPPPVVFEGCIEAEDTDHRYRVLVGLRNLDNQQRTLLEEYFHTSLN